MKKLFNYRPMLFGFVVLLCGIYLSTTILKVSIFVNLAFLIISIVLIFILCFVKPLSNFKFKGIFLLSVFIFSLIIGSGTILSYQKLYTLNKIEMAIEGVVTDSTAKLGASSKFKLRDVKLDGKKYSGNLELTIYGSAYIRNLSAGDKVSFNGKIGINSLIRPDGSSDFSSLYDPSKFFASVGGANLTIVEGRPNIFESIRMKTKENIYKFIPNDDFAESCYAVLFGDKSNLNSDISGTFRTAGVAHLLAISGLHIGLLIAVLFFVLKLFRIRKLPKFIIGSAFLLGYCFLAGFTPSVCRAAIMIATYLLASVLGQQKDSISTLSLAGIIIVVLNPFVCFNISFILSFTCIFAIFTLVRPLESVIGKIKFLNKAAVSSISMSIAVNIAILPITAFFFKEVALIGVISNLFLIPLFSVMFSVLFIFAVLGLIWSWLGVGLYVAGFLFEIIFYVAGYFAFVPAINIRTALWVCALTFIIIFMVSNFSFIKSKFKYIIMGAFVALVAVSSICYSLPQNYGTAFIKTEITGANIISSQNGRNALILENYTKKEMDYALNSLNKERFYKIDAVIVIEEIDQKSLKDFTFLANQNKQLTIFLCSVNADILTVVKDYENIIILEMFKETKFFEFDFISVGKEDNCMGVAFINKNFKFLFSTASSETEIKYLNKTVPTSEFDFVVSEIANSKTLRLNTKKLVSYTQNDETESDAFITRFDGEFVFK